MIVGAKHRAVMVAAVVAVLLLSACGGSSSKKSPSTSPKPSSTVKPISQKSAESHLITAADVVPLVKASFTPNSHALPCELTDGPGVATTTHALYNIGVRFSSAKPKATVIEEVLAYPTTDAANAALLTIRNGFDCVIGKRYGVPGTPTISVGPLQDFSSKLKVSQAYSWQQSTKDEARSDLVILYKTSIVFLHFSAAVTSNLQELPSGDDVANKAVELLKKT